MLKRPATLFACLLVAGLLVLGLSRLFELRFDQGDMYPPYSTLRADPLGASVLYESLERVPDVTAHRYFEPTFKDDDGRARALFILGAEPYSMRWLSRSEFDVLQRFVFNGGRIVIAYYPEVEETWTSRLESTNNYDHPVPGKQPQNPKPEPEEKTDGNNGGVGGQSGGQPETNRLTGTNAFVLAKPAVSTNTPAATNHAPIITFKDEDELLPRHERDARRHEKSRQQQEKDDEQEDLKAEMHHYADLPDEWGFHFNYKALGTNDDGQIEFPQARLIQTNSGLPGYLAVHTALCFTNLTNGWKVVYQRDHRTPVVVERKFGAGSVVLVADAYPLSNEAMFKDRSAPLLAWLLGSGRDAVFDEAHLGVVEEPGIATLMRRYRLHGLVFSLLAVAGLFVWKNSQSLVPPPPEGEPEAGPVVAGRDSAAGFINLLRRGIAPAEILNVCFGEWRRAGGRAAAVSTAQLREVEQLVRHQASLEPHLRTPIESYRAISHILQRRK